MNGVVELGRYLASKRVLLGLKTREVSEKTGISAIYISEIETGKKIPTRGNVLEELSNFYTLDYEAVKEMAIETKMRADFRKLKSADSERIKVARSIMNLSDDDLKDIRLKLGI